MNKHGFNLKKLQDACDLVEKAMRQIGNECEVITLNGTEGVQLAPLSWGGAIQEPTLFAAILQGLNEKDDH